MDRYEGIFAADHWNGARAGWPVVQREFGMTEKEPTEVLVADYEYENYSGDALIVFRRGRQYWLVEGGHCSCYGLEGQWSPEGPYSKASLRGTFERIGPKTSWSGMKERHRDRVLGLLA